MSIARKAILGTFWVAGASYSSFIISFGAQLILVRLLFPEDFGTYALAASIIGLISLFFSWDFSSGLIQVQGGKYLNETAFALSVIQGVVFLIFTGLTSIVLTHFFSTNLVTVFFVIGLTRPLTFISSVYSATVEKELIYKKLSIIRFISAVVAAIGGITLAYRGFGVWSIVGKELLMTLVCFIGFRAVSPWRFTWRFDRESSKRLIRFSWGMLFSRGLEAAWFKLDNLLVGSLLGTTSLGYYSQGRYFVDLGNTAVAPAATKVAFPFYSKLQKDPIKLSQACHIVNFFLIRLMFPLALILILFPEPIITLLYGSKWSPTAPIIRFLALCVVIVPVSENLKILLYSLGRFKEIIRLRLIQILILIPALFIGVKLYGAMGAAIAFMLSAGIGVVGTYYYTREYTINYVKRNYITPVVLGVFIFIFMLIFSHYVNIPTKGFAFILSVILFIILYGIGLFVIEKKVLKENIVMLMEKIWLRDAKEKFIS